MEKVPEFKDDSGLACNELHLRFMRAFGPPLGGDIADRIVYAEVRKVDEEKMTLLNLITALEFELPMNIFRFIPRVGERLTIDRVHRRVMAQVHHSSNDMVRLEIML